jgi:hypothetical protein
MAYSEKHLAAFKRWKDFGGLRHSGACKFLEEEELTALLEDPNFRDEVTRERQWRTDAVLAPKPAPAPPPQTVPSAVLAELKFRDDDTLESYATRNGGKAAPVAFVHGLVEGVQESVNRTLNAVATKNRHRNRRLDEIERTLGILPALPDHVDRGRWEDAVVYYPNDVVDHEGKAWRCVGQHRASDKSAPSTGEGSANLWEALEAPKALRGDGSSVLERLAAVERALGITPPEHER